MQNLNQINNDVPILKKTFDLYKEFYQYLKVIPKKDQYMIGKRCEEYILIFMELILSAVEFQKPEKLKILKQANGKFEVLKVLIRLTRELKILDNKKYLSLTTEMQEIGKMLGGWMKSLQ
ncbi:MAG: four helix bundle protein [Patescibacteria group bacterium]